MKVCRDSLCTSVPAIGLLWCALLLLLLFPIVKDKHFDVNTVLRVKLRLVFLWGIFGAVYEVISIFFKIVESRKRLIQCSYVGMKDKHIYLGSPLPLHAYQFIVTILE